ncbi:MAG: 4,5-DOPA dioxygenase extradiol [Spirosomataceae bacterium]
MNRRDFIKNSSIITTGAVSLSLTELDKLSNNFAITPTMPVIFIGHGSPMNAIEDNKFTQSLKKLGKSIVRPNAILVVSAHWLTNGTAVSSNPAPKTIYDFGGFPDALYKVKYEPKGNPNLAKEIAQIGNTIPVHEDNGMGLDHGSWTVLRHIYPNADIPVLQLSIDYYKPPQFHFDLGQSLKKLREKGVMIIGSGNVVHNLGKIKPTGSPYDWAIEFDVQVKKHLDTSNFQPLVDYQKFGSMAQLSIPTHDHYTPMLYILGLANKNEKVNYFYEGLELGSLSMRSFIIS